MRTALAIFGTLALAVFLVAASSTPAPRFASPLAIPSSLVQRDSNASFQAVEVQAVGIDAGEVVASNTFACPVGTACNLQSSGNSLTLSALGGWGLVLGGAGTGTVTVGNSGQATQINGTVTIAGDVTSSATTGVQHGCSGAATCNFESAAGQNATFDTGSTATSTASLGAFNATTTNVGRSGQTTNIAGAVTIASDVTSSATTGTQFGCSGAATCNFASASGQTAAFDTGGGTSTASLGATNATTTIVGRSGQTTNINGNVTMPTPAWTAPTLTSPFVNNGAPNAAAGYLKTADGKVCVKGDVDPTSATASAAPIFTLPVGYRPTENRQWVAMGYNGSNLTYYIEVTSAGVVQCNTALSAGNQVNLEICFYP